MKYKKNDSGRVSDEEGSVVIGDTEGSRDDAAGDNNDAAAGIEVYHGFAS